MYKQTLQFIELFNVYMSHWPKTAKISFGLNGEMSHEDAFEFSFLSVLLYEFHYKL